MIGNLARATWRSAQVAAALVAVLVPFAFAVTNVLFEVVMATGCGLAVGIGLSLRTGEQIGRSAGILIGTVTGIATVLLAGLFPGTAVIWIVPLLLALAVGMVDGLGTSRLREYREAGKEALIIGSPSRCLGWRASTAVFQVFPRRSLWPAPEGACSRP